jgi:erythromycin esterase-like protein
MAWNVEQIVEHLYPDEKVIVWAHNDHVRHDHAAVRPESGPPRGVGMGMPLRERYGSGLYTIGLYMLHGASEWMETPGEVVPSSGAVTGKFGGFVRQSRRGKLFR